MIQNNVLVGSRAESFGHKAIKNFFIKFISDHDSNVLESSLEKRIGNRKADVYFKLRNRKNIVIEIQSSWISKQEIQNRTKEYNESGCYVLWILNGKGNILASPKPPESRSDIKISPAENFLHWLYEGRVYYVNINKEKYTKTVSLPYGLHYSRSKNQPYHSIYEDFEYYYLRNAHFIKIPSWNLLCKEKKHYKIARFYDKRPVV